MICSTIHAVLRVKSFAVESVPQQNSYLSFFSTNILLGSIFLHMKARELWQNFPKFSKISPHDNFFSTNIICDICDKYELCGGVLFSIEKK